VLARSEAGRATEIALRLLGPILLGLAVLAVRGASSGDVLMLAEAITATYRPAELVVLGICIAFAW
jgi:hypothetical protein